MWRIKHIFDGNYGCEDDTYDKGEAMVSVTLINDEGEEKYESVADSWLTGNGLDVGSEWPDYSGVRIETENVILRKAAMEDWKSIYDNLWCHADSAKYMLWEPTTTEHDAKERMKRTLAFQKKHKYALFIYDKVTGEAIGFAGMRECEPGIFEETGIAIGPDYVGKGYGTQILSALISEARKNGGVRFLSACRKQNKASHRVQEKCGFVFSHDEECVDYRNDEKYVLEHNVLEL